MWNPERASNIKLFINKYKGINYPLKIDDWKAFEKIIQQLILIFCILKRKKYVPAYISKHNSTREK